MNTKSLQKELKTKINEKQNIISKEINNMELPNDVIWDLTLDCVAQNNFWFIARKDEQIINEYLNIYTESNQEDVIIFNWYSKNQLFHFINTNPQEKQIDNDLHEVVAKSLYNIIYNLLVEKLNLLIWKHLISLFPKFREILEEELKKGWSKQIEQILKHIDLGTFWKMLSLTIPHVIDNTLINEKIEIESLFKKTEETNDKQPKNILELKDFEKNLIEKTIKKIVILFLSQEDLTIKVFFKDFEKILNSIEYNYLREYSLYNSFLIFKKYLDNINTDLVNFKNFFLINKDILLVNNFSDKIADKINFDFIDIDLEPEDRLFFIKRWIYIMAETILYHTSLFIQYLEKNKDLNKQIKKYYWTILNKILNKVNKIDEENIRNIINYISFLFEKTNYDIIWIVQKGLETDNISIEIDKDFLEIIEKIDKTSEESLGHLIIVVLAKLNLINIHWFMDFLNNILDINKTIIKINGKTFFINDTISKEWKKFKQNYYISKNHKETINDILDLLYKKIIIQQIINKKWSVSNLLLLGPTGSGKSYFAEALAKEFNDNFTVIEANYLKDWHTFTNIVGASAWYVGYNNLANWQAKIKEINQKDEFGVLLIDEVEKADPEILDLFLQVMDQWKLVLSNWTELDFSKIIIIFTSNYIKEETSRIWFVPESEENNIMLSDWKSDEIKSRLLDFFKPEFLGRIDMIKIIPSYNKDELYEIFDFILDKLLNKYHITDKQIIKKIKANLEKQKDNIVQDTFNKKENIRLLYKTLENKIFDYLLIQ